MRKLASFFGAGNGARENSSSANNPSSGSSSTTLSTTTITTPRGNNNIGGTKITTRTKSQSLMVNTSGLSSQNSEVSPNGINGRLTPKSRSSSNSKINISEKNIEQEIQNVIFNTAHVNTISKVPNVQPEYYLKFVVLGGPSVGKTSVVNRYLKNKDHPSLSITSNGLYIPTIGIDLYSKPVKKYRDTSITKCKALQFPIRLTILDIPHSEFMKQSVSKYFESAHGVLLAFDVTNIKSISAVDQWRTKIPSHLLTSTVLIANKAELKPHIITPNSLDNYVRDSGLLAWFSTSVRNYQSINGAFQYLIERSITKMIKKYNGLPTLNHQMNAVSLARKASTPLVDSKSDILADTSPYSTSIESNSDTGSMSRDDSKQLPDGPNSLCDLLEDKNPNLTI